MFKGRGKGLVLAVVRFLVLCLLFAGSTDAAEDALPIVEKAFEAAKANQVIARSYVYQERVEERRFDKKGEEKRKESRTHDVTLLDTSEYRRLIAVNDEPLDEKTAAKEQRRLEKQIKKMRNETPKQREKRLAKVEQDQIEVEEFLEEITRAFDFRRTGEEEIDGVMTHVISAEPKAGYEPSSREAKVLTRLRGTLWIAQDDHAWVKADMETTDGVKWAFFKLHEGAILRFTQRHLNDEVWLPDSWYVRLRAKAALVFHFNGEFSGSYRDYKRFTADSTVVEQGVAP